MRRLVTCPERGCLVEIEAKESPIDGQITRISHCSLWRQDPEIECVELCAERMNRKRLAQRKRS
jgi:hypothetical protein